MAARCSYLCGDQPGWTTTTCVSQASLGIVCLRQCTTATNAAECPAGSACTEQRRPDGKSRMVCVPKAPRCGMCPLTRDCCWARAH